MKKGSENIRTLAVRNVLAGKYGSSLFHVGKAGKVCNRFPFR